MVTVRIGRVYDEPTGQEDVRVLVDRMWPRGLNKAQAALDEWCKQVAPSDTLRKWYGHSPQRFAEFRSRYQVELSAPEPAATVLHLRELAKQRPLLLLTAEKDPSISEVAILAEMLGEDVTAG
jgi:uncharacterized protein YeaO (DUF488 family)